jgi:hypothetical protein
MPADIHGLYAAIGIALPAHHASEAPARCFVDPAAHARGDHDRSMSVNLSSGAFYCHGCLAAGGAYDACIASGRSPREAIDLMIGFGLVARGSVGGSLRPVRRPTPLNRRAAQRSLAITEQQIRGWALALESDDQRLAELQRSRGWHRDLLRDRQVGSDDTRLTIPVRDRRERLVAVMRYLEPARRGDQPKMLAVAGSRRALYPHPARLSAIRLLIVEGHPDGLCAASHGLAATAIAGHGSWEASWSKAFAGRAAVVCPHCDEPGRAAARRIADDLAAINVEVSILDLDPSRSDGYDLTDHLLANGELHDGALTKP